MVYVFWLLDLVDNGVVVEWVKAGSKGGLYLGLGQQLMFTFVWRAYLCLFFFII